MSTRIVASKYQLGDCIGKGGFGSVYKALNTETGDFVAVKCISLKNVSRDDAEGIQTSPLFQSEIDLLNKLHHKHITRYVDHNVTKDELYLVMEFVENGSLQNVVKKFGVFPEHLVGIYVSQVLEGLKYLHSEGVIHRDIKGANILTTKDGVIKLADFGVAAKLVDAQCDSSVVGTPYWMAPEIIELNPPQYESDIWSLGCTVVELLEGSPPYYNLDPMPALFRIVQDEHPPMPTKCSQLLRDFLLQCFQKDPNHRASATQLLKHKWIFGSKRKSTMTTIDEDVAVIQKHNIPKPKVENVALIFSTNVVPEGDIPVNEAPVAIAVESSAIAGAAGDRLAKYAEDDAEDDWGDDIDEEEEDDILTKAATVKDIKLNIFGSESAHLSEQWGEPNGEDDVEWPSSAHPSPKPQPVTLRGMKPGKRNVIPAIKVTEKEDEDNYDEFFAEEEDKEENPSEFARKLRDKVTQKRSQMMNIRPEALAQPMIASGDSSLAKYTEFGEEDGDFDEIDGEMEDLSKRLKEKLTDTYAEEDSADAADDPFAEMDEEDGSMDEYPSITTGDSVYTLGTTVEDEIAKLTLESDEEDILSSCASLLDIFQRHPLEKNQLITHHGIVPITELLEHSLNPRILLALLKVINNIISDNFRFKENLCLMGVLPTVIHFVSPGFPPAVRYEAGRFLKEMCYTSNLTLQMFISCRGITSLVDLMKHTSQEYAPLKNTILIAIDCTLQVFSVEGRIPKNDFSRIFVRSGLASHLSDALKHIVEDVNLSYRESYVDKIASIFLLFSHGDKVVKSQLAEMPILLNFLAVLDDLSGPILLKMLKCIKEISMVPDTLDPLQRAGFVQKLVRYFSRIENESSDESSHVHGASVSSDIRNQVSMALYNLCRINKDRQELAAVAGIVPHLQGIISSNSPLSQFALPMMCDLAHASAKCLAELWRHDGVQFYVNMLNRRFWQANAVDALAAWISSNSSEKKRVEIVLRKETFVEKLVSAFSTRDLQTFSALVIPFSKLLQASVKLSETLSESAFVSITMSRLQQQFGDPQIRLRLISILESIYYATRTPKLLIKRHGIVSVFTKMVEEEKKVIVKEKAKNFLEALEANEIL